MDSFSDLCNPAKVYVVLVAFSLIFMIFSKNYGPAIAKFIFAIIFTYFLNWLCNKGYPGVSWFIVLIPFVIIGLGAIFVVSAVKGAKQASKMQAQAQAQAQQNQQPHY
jgi:predicted PurR-regulated permease PerM